MKFEHYIFDLDGTIANTKGIHQRAFNQTLVDFGLKAIAEEDLHLYEAMPSFNKIEKYNALNDKKINDKTAFIDRKNIWSMHFIKSSEDMFPIGIYEIFSKIDREGKQISICSNCTLESIIAILKKGRILQFIDQDAIFHNKSCAPKPDPQMYRLALQRARVAPSDSVIFEDGTLGVSAALQAHPMVSVVRVSSPETLIQFFL